MNNDWVRDTLAIVVTCAYIAINSYAFISGLTVATFNHGMDLLVGAIIGYYFGTRTAREMQEIRQSIERLTHNGEH